MQTDCLQLPDHALMKKHVIQSLSPYWTRGCHLIELLPVSYAPTPVTIKLPLKLCEIAIPDWGKKWAINGFLLVPEELLPLRTSLTNENLWQDVDWFSAMFIMLEAWHERTWEAKYGPIHSYSFRLKDWDNRVWQKAWVNRIALFLRAWAARKNGVSADDFFGPLPKCQFLVTHDVDALNKTLAIRLKQSVFIGFNTFRLLFSWRIAASFDSLKKVVRMISGNEDWWTFNDLLALEKNMAIRGTFHFHTDQRPLTFKRWLFDPNYSTKSKRVQDLFSKLQAEGHKIGLHPGFDSWDDRCSMQAQKSKLEAATNTKISACRQHWLRFSWSKTWLCQESIGLTSDTTLMFNDRPGFRNASAIGWYPWDNNRKNTYTVKAHCTVLMDSHLYDYQQLNDIQRTEQLMSWLEECSAVNGEVAVLWHPHTLTDDYGWREGFASLLKNINTLRKHEDFH